MGNAFEKRFRRNYKEENQYGKNVQTLALSLMNTENVSINKTRKMICGFSEEGINPSEGYIAKLQKRAAVLLASFQEELRHRFLSLGTIYWDDMVIDIHTHRACLRLYGDERAALYKAHWRKDKEGIDQDGILALLPREAVVMHDHNRVNYNLLKDIDFLGLEKLNLMMGRGFYSEKNINDLMKHHHKFLIGVKASLKTVKNRLDTIRSDFITRQNFNAELHLYVQSFRDEWDYTEEKPDGTVITDKRRIYLLDYYNDQHATDDRDRFNHLLDCYEEELRNKKRKPEHEAGYKKYFDIKETPVRGIRKCYCQPKLTCF